MEEKKSDILTSINRRDGMTVPDGFFESFAERMASELPSRPEAEVTPVASRPKTLWGSIRPYVYMAAMFAGIWCMLKMFTMMNPGDVDLVTRISFWTISSTISTNVSCLMKCTTTASRLTTCSPSTAFLLKRAPMKFQATVFLLPMCDAGAKKTSIYKSGDLK